MTKLLIEIVKNTINLKIKEAQRQKIRSLDQKIAELDKAIKKTPINKNIVQSKVENIESARHLLKLKTASPLMNTLLIAKSIKIVNKAKAKPRTVPKIMPKNEKLIETVKAVDPIKQRIKM